jgi:RNA polymerase sigma-70 factor (ECF subfamily)
LIYENPDLPHAEAAAQVGLSVQRVRQILCEVRKRLRAVLSER